VEVLFSRPPNNKALQTGGSSFDWLSWMKRWRLMGLRLVLGNTPLGRSFGVGSEVVELFEYELFVAREFILVALLWWRLMLYV